MDTSLVKVACKETRISRNWKKERERKSGYLLEKRGALRRMPPCSYIN
jgi:hypothetical protein